MNGWEIAIEILLVLGILYLVYERIQKRKAESRNQGDNQRGEKIPKSPRK